MEEHTVETLTEELTLIMRSRLRVAWNEGGADAMREVLALVRVAMSESRGADLMPVIRDYLMRRINDLSVPRT